LGSKLAKINSEALNLAVVTDEFNIDMFAKNVDTEQHIEEDDKTARRESDEENRQPSVDATLDVAVGPGGKGNEANVPSSPVTLCDIPTSSRIDWSSYYTDEVLMSLKLKHISLKDCPNHNDISHIGSVVCDTAVVDDEVNPRV
jgi:hypothetical protein